MVTRTIRVSKDFDLLLGDIKKRNPEFSKLAITKLMADNMRRNETEFIISPHGFSKKRRVHLKKKKEVDLFDLGF